MKRFHFALEKVLDFRRRQLELEEARLETLNSERRTLDSEASRIRSEVADTQGRLMVTASVEAQDLAASDRYLRHLSAETKRHAAKLTEWQDRARKQQQAIVAARRNLRLMEKLEERELREWKTAADREQENLASELYLARWKKKATLSLRPSPSWRRSKSRHRQAGSGR